MPIMPQKGKCMIYDLQKASMWKRISAYLFDGIMLSIAAVLFAWLLSVALGVDGHQAVLEERYDAYEMQYGVSFDLSLAEYEALSAEQSQALNDAYAALGQDEEAVYAYNMVIQLTILITTFGILLAFMVLEYTVPMVLGNGQTLGKKIFGVALMRAEGIRINGVSLFIRTLLGKYAIETMIPVLILLMLYFGVMGVAGTVILLVLALVQVVMLIVTKTNSAIHDFLANTVAVDLASQMIFNTREDMIAYKQKMHAERAAKQPY